MFNGEVIPNTYCLFKLNWASGGGLIDRKKDRQPEYSIFLGDLSSNCSEDMLLNLFRARYRSYKSAKIMTDPLTSLTRGYGFIRFHSQFDQHQAMNEMQGFFIGNRPIRTSLATPKNSHCDSPISPVLIPQMQNTTVFVDGLSYPIQEEELRKYFSIFGSIVYVKIPPGKGCGFVQFVSRQSAEMAIDQMNGYQIGTSRIRLSWGRPQNQPYKKQEMTTKVHPFDKDKGFITLLNNLPSTASLSSNNSADSVPIWSSDYHIFAQ